MIKPQVLQYWLRKLRLEASALTSLRFLKTDFLGLSVCHPMIRLCSSSPREVQKLTIVSRLLSGRYRLESVSKFFTPWNRDGMCCLPLCWNSPWSHKGDLESFICHCKSLELKRTLLLSSLLAFLSSSSPRLLCIVREFLESDSLMTQFFLDCSTLPEVIREVQVNGEGSLKLLLKLTRNYCFGLHTERTNQLSSNGNRFRPQ